MSNYYIGINGKARKIKSAYIGVNGVARKITSGYIGVNNTAHLFTAEPYYYYGVKIQLVANSQAVEYIDDAVSVGSHLDDVNYANWEKSPLFSKIRPCLLKNGVVLTYLDKDNPIYDIDGNDVTYKLKDPVNYGDVMVEIPKIGYKIETSSDGEYVTVHITNDPKASGYCYYAHTYSTEGDCSKIYVGAFNATVINNVPYSYISENRNGTENIESAWRTAVGKKGTRYLLYSFYIDTLLQCLFLLKYADRQFSRSVGFPISKVWNTCKVGNSYLLNKGRDSGAASNTDYYYNAYTSFLNIENFCTADECFIDGVSVTASYPYGGTSGDIVIKTAYSNFGTSSKYQFSYSIPNPPGTILADVRIPKKVMGNNQFGFLPKITQASYSENDVFYWTNDLVDGDDSSEVGQYWVDYCELYGGEYNFTTNDRLTTTSIMIERFGNRDPKARSVFNRGWICSDFKHGGNSDSLPHRIVYKKA